MSFWAGVVAGVGCCAVFLVACYAAFIFWLMRECP